MRPEKEAILKEIKQKVDASEFLLLADYRGMTVEQFSALRASLRGSGARIQVVKNSLLQLVAREKGWSAIEPHLAQFSAMVVGKNVVEAAKAIKKFRAEAKNRPEMKAGMMGDTFLSFKDIEDLASMPPREVLLAQMVGTIAAPMTRLVGVMNQKVCSLLYVLKAVEQKKSEAA
ncbi:MAG: 50S ribosomal protein L10 [Kiritimatiellia bacterium]|jgi:large subunit ribosomal protein L10